MEVTSIVIDASDAADALWGADGHDGIIVVEGPSALEPVLAIVVVHGGAPVAACGMRDDDAVESLAVMLRGMLAESNGRQVTADAA